MVSALYEDKIILLISLPRSGGRSDVIIRVDQICTNLNENRTVKNDIGQNLVRYPLDRLYFRMAIKKYETELSINGDAKLDFKPF